MGVVAFACGGGCCGGQTFLFASAASASIAAISAVADRGGGPNDNPAMTAAAAITRLAFVAGNAPNQAASAPRIPPIASAAKSRYVIVPSTALTSVA